ncbi:MAG: pilus assembly protein TadG-related protein, partial [Acidimicrobiia bacterium]|nr:pilus assembly protein TadG-related protein [Acidimicrobiia bacterium]
MRWFTRDDSGAVLVVVALAMLLLLGVAALSLDGGRGLNEERDSQNVADQASLAAAWAACNGRDPQAAGLASAAANGFNNDGITNTVTITDLGNGRFEAVVASIIEGTFSKTVGADTITARSQAVATCDITTGLGGFALFSGSTSCGPVDLDLTGSSQTIEGGIHSNDQLKINGNVASPSKIYGPVTAVASVAYNGVLFFDTPGDTTESTPGTNPTQGVNVRPYPADFKIAAYAPPQGAAAFAAYFPFSTDQSWSNVVIAPGVYYVDGDVDLHDVSGEHVTIVATGQISLTGTNLVNTITVDTDPLYGPYDPSGLALFSTYQNSIESCNRNAIKWSGSAHIWGGIQYAPFGNI